MFFTLILENENGDRVNMTTTANQYMTSKIEGLNPPPGTISTSSYAGMDGSYLNNAFIEKRNVVIHFEMRGVNVEARRHQLYKVVKPSRYIKIYYATANIDVYAEGYVKTCEVNNFETLTTGQISILCPDIYWYSTISQMAYYSQITGAFTFLFPSETNPEPFVLGKYNTQNMMTIENDGDDTGFILVIEASSITEVATRSPTIYNADMDEYLQITGDILNGDYLTVSGRFLMCLLERRIIHPIYSVTTETAYSDIVQSVVKQNAISNDNRRIPGLSLGTVFGSCWEQTTKLQVSYTNLMEWVYTICEKIGRTANIRLVKDTGEKYRMVLDLLEGTDRSLMQEENPHIIFSYAYSNLLSFSYAVDTSVQLNFAYIFGHGEGAERKRTTYCDGEEPAYLECYEVYVDADDISEEEQVEGETDRFRRRNTSSC